MTFLPYLMLGFGLVATIAFMAARVKVGGPVAVLLKTLASLFFIATGASALFVTGDLAFGVPIVLGLVFGLVGDITLDVMVVYPEDNDVWRYGGMISFFVGHIVYLVGIYTTMPAPGGDLWMVIALPVAIALVLAVVAVLGGPKMGLDYGKFKLISFGYAFLLAFMTVTTGVIMGLSDFALRWIFMFVGAVLFLLSDLILSQQYFGPPEKMKNPVLIVTNHSTYYLAQFFIALSILFV